MSDISLLGSTTRVETPYIKVKIGNYVFGVYQRTGATVSDENGSYLAAKIVYPNYVKSLKIEKINGQVNQYSLSLVYPIRPEDDPNFFEKVFSSVNKTRKIIFSYGDMSNPTYIYKDEEAIITNIGTSFDLPGGNISYSISAVSSAALGYSGNYNFPGVTDKPSNIIKSILNNPYYGLKEIFYGMIDDEIVASLGLIPGNDAVVPIEGKYNISILDYLKYLVSCMIPDSAVLNSNQQNTFYVLTIRDEVIGETINNSKVETLGGPYFQIDPVSSTIEHADAYEITIGYPTQNIITAFQLTNNENYSIYYDWQSTLTDNEYVMRLDDGGDWEKEYAPVVSSGNDEFKTQTADKTWWTKITKYPVSASVTLKGLLRPATLMEYVKLNVLFFGKKHISSGMYIVTKQTDTIDSRGYRTTLDLTRIEGESAEDYAA